MRKAAVRADKDAMSASDFFAFSAWPFVCHWKCSCSMTRQMATGVPS